MSRPRKADDLLLVALSQGKTHAEAARIADVSERTVRRRLEDPEFATRVEHRRAEVTAAAAGQLAGLYGKAIGALSDLLDHGDDPLRVRAAQIILRSVLEFRSHADFEERLLAIEETIQNSS